MMFKQGGDGEGFNATFTIFSCPDQCPGNRTCVNNQCVCNDGWTGPNCSLPLCPQNCSFHLKQGVCDRVTLINLFPIYVYYFFFLGLWSMSVRSRVWSTRLLNNCPKRPTRIYRVIQFSEII